MGKALLAPAILCLALAGCGSSASGPSPTATVPATAVPVYTDKGSGITVRVVKAYSGPTYALALVKMRNASSSEYQSPSTVPFRDTSYIEPNTGSSAAACDADDTHGPGLSYLTVPARTTNTGWIRCDYPKNSHFFVLIWQNHIVGSFRITV